MDKKKTRRHSKELNNSEIDNTRYTIESWAVRNGFAHWAIALIWLIITFVLFQLTAGLVYALLLFATGEIENISGLGEAMMTRLDLLFIGNSTGQIIFLGLATFAVVRLHLSGESVRSFMRMNWDNDTSRYMVIAVIFAIVIQPLVLFLGHLNSMIPVPDSLIEMQESQFQMLEAFLKSDGVVWFALLNIALVPAFAEEFLFRGYILRAFEKSWGIIAAIVLSSLIFGMFHLQLTNLLPLATLGGMLAILTWVSASVWPAVLAHFLNNGAAVIMATYYPELAFADTTASAMPPIWALALSIILTGYILWYLFNSSKQNVSV